MATIIENLQTILDIKQNIKTAIINKGVEVANDDSFNSYAEKIDSIETPQYDYLSGTVDVEGLENIGWSNESVGYFRDNTPHYHWENNEYIVNEANKTLKDTVVNTATIQKNKNNPNMEFVPYPISVTESNTFSDCKYIKGIPLINTNGFSSLKNMFRNCTALKTIPPINTSNSTNLDSLFYGCSSLVTIPLLDTAKTTNFNSMFYNCSSLVTIPQLDTTNALYLAYMFRGCKALMRLPLFDTKKVVNFHYMFRNCTSLKTVPPINTQSANNVSYMFYGCIGLTNLPLFNFGNVTNIGNFFGTTEITTLTDLGGFENLKINWNDDYGLYKLPNLTYQSVLNVINNLYDFRDNGNTTTRTIKLHPNSISLLSDKDIAIATNKGWIIS